MSDKPSFKKPPLTPEEKKKKEAEFLRFDKTGGEISSQPRKKEKEPTKSIFIRAPESFWHDIQEIVSLTGISMNAVCLELLRPAIKRKLKEIRDDS